MSPLQAWLTKPRATVRIDASMPWAASPWAAWMKVLRRPFAGKQVADRIRIEVLDRLSLGGKKSLLLVSIEGRRLLVGVGDDAPPSIAELDAIGSAPSSRVPLQTVKARQRRRRVR